MQHNLHEGLKFYADLSRLLGELRDAVKDVSLPVACPPPSPCDRVARGSFADDEVLFSYASYPCSLYRHEKPTRMRGCSRFRRRNQQHRQPPSPPTLHQLRPIRPERDLPLLLLPLPLLLHVGLGLPLREGGRPDHRARSATISMVRQISRRWVGTLRRASGSGERGRVSASESVGSVSHACYIP